MMLWILPCPKRNRNLCIKTDWSECNGIHSCSRMLTRHKLYSILLHWLQPQKKDLIRRQGKGCSVGLGDRILAALAVLPRSFLNKQLNSTICFKKTKAKQLVQQGRPLNSTVCFKKTASAARILSRNLTQRPLPCLLIQSFFYGFNRCNIQFLLRIFRLFLGQCAYRTVDAVGNFNFKFEHKFQFLLYYIVKFSFFNNNFGTSSKHIFLH